MNDGCSFAKTICSICYEDLKPLVEDLQAIPICGHVFHELCLQQWFEHCLGSSKKKCNCPVCKQTCSQSSVRRLYFQSVGNDPILSQKSADYNKDPEALLRKVKILEVKVSGLISTLEDREKNLKNLNEELCLCKERANKEETAKNETLSQKAILQQMLKSKSEEHDRSTMECLKLQERNLALAKEIASFKLISDLNLEEEEVLKFASLGNKANSTDTIDILKRSLVIRNKSYKELMEKCNLLGRGEARSLGKLEKAKEKLNKLKGRVHELEMAIEVKDNEYLRTLKASKEESKCKVNGVQHNSNTFPINNNNSLPVREENIQQCDASVLGLASKKDTPSMDQENVSYIVLDDDDNVEYPKTTLPDLKPTTGDGCFSGGLMGADGSSRYLGKWCKRIIPPQKDTVGDLISVGADGRGGRIKVLRSLNHNLETPPVLAKKCKHGTQTNTKGCLQIDHFFGKLTR